MIDLIEIFCRLLVESIIISAPLFIVFIYSFFQSAVLSFLQFNDQAIGFSFKLSVFVISVLLLKGIIVARLISLFDLVFVNLFKI